MKKVLIAVFFIVLFSATASSVHAQEGTARLTLDDFSTSKVGDFPKRWRTWPLQHDKAAEVYRIAEEGGRRFIRAEDTNDISQQIFLNFNWKIMERPKLSWKWRATTLPAGARESDDATNDSACGVYVVIGKYDGHAIKYVWSSSLAPGTVVTRRDGKLKIKVLGSGAAKLRQWIEQEVDVPADYEALFGEKLGKNPSGIAILTDGNAVHKTAGCDYSGFAISRKAP